MRVQWQDPPLWAVHEPCLLLWQGGGLGLKVNALCLAKTAAIEGCAETLTSGADSSEDTSRCWAVRGRSLASPPVYVNAREKHPMPLLATGLAGHCYATTLAA